MDDAQVDALVAVADDGVDCDGLVATTDDDGYVIAVDGERHEGLSEARFRSLAAEHPRFVENWHFWAHGVPPGEDRRAFLRWLEDADAAPLPERLERLDHGVEATWGQLHVTVGLAGDGFGLADDGLGLADDGHRTDAERDADDERNARGTRVGDGGGGSRRYALRHVDDVGVDAGDLDDHDDPLDARQLAKLDDRGRYRPLKTAPSLQCGWRFPDLDPAGIVRAVECFYPATIPNWHREREGDLDVDHWRDAAERQTGIYDVIEELPREAVEWVAEACCVDSQCLKRREWQYEEGDDLDVDGGDGEFPCREPCSLVIAAARQWTILEGETERTYEFELTPSEKHQIEALIDAVADGRVDEIREADVGEGANRYRARYLRAKRFDEDGDLGGAPATEPEE